MTGIKCIWPFSVFFLLFITNWFIYFSEPVLLFFYTTAICYFKCVCARVCVGFDKQLLYCRACIYLDRIYLDFSILFNCVIRWPVLCHYGVQAWVEAAGEQGLALLLSHGSSPTHPPLPFCLSICLYFCHFNLSSSNLRAVHTNANLCQCNMQETWFFFQHVGVSTIIEVDIFLVLLVGWYCLWLLPTGTVLFFYCFHCSFLLIFPSD